ncbi:MAG: hypothetical protein ABJ000_00475 [Saccharospirillum sp.]|uniref:hypothetical protein n=1 Tax=Saccharospirillum sp. TaxID=2033801 RepID=UPI00329A2FED
MNLQFLAIQIRRHLKQLVIVLFFFLLFALVAVESTFFINVSSGSGVVLDYHKLETNTGSENQLVVRFNGMNTVGSYNGTPTPRIGDDVKVVYEKSLFFRRNHYSYASFENN